LSDKVFSIVKASGGGSTGGGSKGGGSTGGGSTGGGATGGGRDEGATVDDPTGPPAGDDGGDVEATLRITYPSPGQEIEVGEAFDIAYAATGAAKDMEVCLKLIDPNDAPQYILNHGAVGRFAEVTVRGMTTSPSSETGVWRIRVSALFKGDSCSATVDNFGAGSDNPRSEINFIIKAPAVCGDGVVDEGEWCDYDGYRCDAKKTFKSRAFKSAGEFINFSTKVWQCLNKCQSEGHQDVYDRVIDKAGATTRTFEYYHDGDAIGELNGQLATVIQHGYRVCTPE
ncbi:MAG: hypothetical protein P8L34_07215, partial [Arenicellales bacterium]|nr:hypothetical protein [Arenicellales bacterium]